MLTQFPDPVCQQNQLQDQCPIALALLYFSNSGWSQKTLKSRPPSKMITQFADPVCQTFLVLVKSKHLVACLALILQMLTMTMAETERTISRSFRKDGTKKPSNCLMLLYLWSSKIHKNWKFPLAPMGVLAPGSEHARPSAQPPIDTGGNFQHTWLGDGLKKANSKHFSILQKQL